MLVYDACERFLEEDSREERIQIIDTPTSIIILRRWLDKISAISEQGPR